MLIMYITVSSFHGVLYKYKNVLLLEEQKTVRSTLYFKRNKVVVIYFVHFLK